MMLKESRTLADSMLFVIQQRQRIAMDRKCVKTHSLLILKQIFQICMPPACQLVRENKASQTGEGDNNNGNGQLGLLNSLRSRILGFSASLRCALTYPISEQEVYQPPIAELSKLPSPQKSQLKGLQNWLKHSKGGNNFTVKTRGTEIDTWKPQDVIQYISLHKSTEDSDPFMDFIKHVMASIIHNFFSQETRKKIRIGKTVDEESGLTSYSNSNLVKASNLEAAIIPSALPILTIFLPNKVQSTTFRLGLTVLFTIIFTVVLEIFTSAKRIEIFAATATFAAVEVAFIGSAL